jgi:hypothetical protein
MTRLRCFTNRACSGFGGRGGGGRTEDCVGGREVSRKSGDVEGLSC